MKVFLVIGILAFAVQSVKASIDQQKPLNNTKKICTNKGTLKCHRYQRFNDETCQCECRDGCNACHPPQVWNAKRCYCECQNHTKCDSSYQYWDEQSCSCKCLENRRGCCDGKIWNPKECVCDCVNILKCPSNKRFSHSDCNCVCRDYKVCEPPFEWLEETCSCGCPQRKCRENFVRNNKTCKCECNHENAKNCTSPLTCWHPEKCFCICKDAKIECLNGTFPNPRTNCTTCIHRQKKACPGQQKWFRNEGKCRCIEVNQNCSLYGDNGIHVWDDVNCKCKCNIPDDQIVCSIDEYFDYPSCSCLCNVSNRECIHSLVWNPLTCKCELPSMLPSFDQIIKHVNQTLREFPGLKKELGTKKGV